MSSAAVLCVIPDPAPYSSASQDHPVPEAAEDQGAAAESDRGLRAADGLVLHGERGAKKTTTSGHVVGWILGCSHEAA